MKSVNYALRKAYTSAIATLTYEGSSLTAFDEVVPDSIINGSEFKHIILSTQTDNTSLRPKDCFVHNATILVKIVYGVTGAGGKKKHDDIADLILQKILPVSSSNYLNLSSSNFQVVTTELIDDQTQFLAGNTHKVWVRLLRFRHVISET